MEKAEVEGRGIGTRGFCLCFNMLHPNYHENLSGCPVWGFSWLGGVADLQIGADLASTPRKERVIKEWRFNLPGRGPCPRSVSQNHHIHAQRWITIPVSLSNRSAGGFAPQSLRRSPEGMKRRLDPLKSRGDFGLLRSTARRPCRFAGCNVQLQRGCGWVNPTADSDE